MTTKDERPERKQTDESLAVERARTDRALGEKEAAIEEKADVIIERAREEADRRRVQRRNAFTRASGRLERIPALHGPVVIAAR